MDGVAGEVEVEIAVEVVVEPVSLGVEAGEVETVIGCGFGEGAVFVLEEEFVAPGEAFVAGDVADVNVHASVLVYVKDTDPGRPIAGTCDPALLRRVTKLEIPLVDVVFIRPLVIGEVQIGQAVAVNVRCRHATTVVVVEVLDDVEILGFE